MRGQHADGARREGSVLESKIEPVPQLLTGDYVYWIVYLAYIWQVFVRKAPKTPPPLSGFSRKACAICKRETSGQMPNLPYISQISRFSSDELGVCPCISMIGVYREFRVGFNDNPRGENEFMGTRAESQMRRTPHAAHITILAKHVGHEFPDRRCHEPFLDIRSR